MLSAVPMLRLRALVLEQDERAVLRELGSLGIVQLIRTPASADTLSFSPPDRSAELARCDGLLARVRELRAAIECFASTASLEPAPELMSLDQAEGELLVVGEQADHLLKRRRALQDTLTETSAAAERVWSYRGIDLPLADPSRFSFLHFVTGTLPPENLDPLRLEIGENVVLLPLAEKESRRAVVAMSTRSGWPALETLLQRAGFEPELLPAIEGATAETFSERSQSRKEQLAAELSQLDTESRALASRWAPMLAALEKLATTERCLLQAEQTTLRSDSAVLLAGWVPALDAGALEQRLREVTAGRCLIETSRAKWREELPPVLLRHARLLRPFEMLVAAYGLPSYGELEPTLFVALSYVVMFGMMFGDAGQGALLAVTGVIVRRTGRTARIRDVGRLLVFGGLSSTAFGILYGSYFGLEQLKRHALWSDPLAGNPVRLMLAGIGIGVVLISCGLVLNVVNCLRRRDWIGGILGKFGLVGLVFYWGGLALVTGFAPTRSPALMALFLLFPLAGWSLKEPMEFVLGKRAGHPVGPGEGLFAAITQSVVGAFEAVLSYLANTISFVRLAAYAMSHAALLAATFAMADQLKRVAAGLLSIMVIILGNLVAIALEGTVAAVQALRLEYYEFFGKFFSGDGQPFTPFRLTASEQDATWVPRAHSLTTATRGSVALATGGAK